MRVQCTTSTPIRSRNVQNQNTGTSEDRTTALRSFFSTLVARLSKTSRVRYTGAMKLDWYWGFIGFLGILGYLLEEPLYYVFFVFLIFFFRPTTGKDSQ
jgi:hypothetical protein